MLGNPNSRRVAGFVEAANLLQTPVRVVSYVDFLSGRYAPPSAGSLVRIESPGECWETTQRLLLAGIAPMEAAELKPLSAAEINRLTPQRGEIVHPKQWYYGFRGVLEQVGRRWNNANVHWMSTPAAIATTFDKLACLELWAGAELPIPARLPHVDSYDTLRAAARQRHARLFVKLRYGYSAMGALALEWREENIRAITTVEFCRTGKRTQLFVSKRPRTMLSENEIVWLIDALSQEEILVEAWLPKDRWQGRSYDLRIVTIDQQVSHVVGRSSASPFTNLNLDAKRMPEDDVRSRLGDHWPAVEQLARDAAACLPDAAMLGIDVLVHPCRGKFSLLEANGFGDYLPGLLSRGRTTYQAELEQALGRRAVA